MRRLWRMFLAWARLDLTAVCEMSEGMHEFHDYPDGTIKEPIHFHNYTCERCGKQFCI